MSYSLNYVPVNVVQAINDNSYNMIMKVKQESVTADLGRNTLGNLLPWQMLIDQDGVVLCVWSGSELNSLHTVHNKTAADMELFSH